MRACWALLVLAMTTRNCCTSSGKSSVIILSSKLLLLGRHLSMGVASRTRTHTLPTTTTAVAKPAPAPSPAEQGDPSTTVTFFFRLSGKALMPFDRKMQQMVRFQVPDMVARQRCRSLLPQHSTTAAVVASLAQVLKTFPYQTSPLLIPSAISAYCQCSAPSGLQREPFVDLSLVFGSGGSFLSGVALFKNTNINIVQFLFAGMQTWRENLQDTGDDRPHFRGGGSYSVFLFF